MTARCALVTGATGFVGQHLVRHLQRAGWQVDVIVRSTSDTTALKDQPEPVSFYEYDNSMDSVLSILAESKPDVVFHLASLVLSEHQPDDITPLIQSNLLFGVQLVEAMTQVGVTSLINTGTFWQHYEGRAYSPVNLYAATKQAFEDLLQYYIEAQTLRVITLKLYDTYGPDDPRPKLINLLRRLASDGQALAMSPGEQQIDLTHVDDVSRAFLVAADRFIQGVASGHERYAISSGQPLELRAVVDKIQRILGRKLPIEWGERPYRTREVMQTWRGSSLPGWEPMISLESWLAGSFATKRVSVQTPPPRVQHFRQTTLR